MNLLTQDCSNPHLYDEFVNSFLLDNSSYSTPSNFSSRRLRGIRSDPKIVDEVKKYFSNSGEFNAPFIYNRAFSPSYRQAITDMSEITAKKGKLFLNSLRDNNSTIHHIPKDIISFILKKFIFKPSVKDFQCQFFKQINFVNPEVLRQIKEQIQSSRTSLMQ